jgi:hypothetical protein
MLKRVTVLAVLAVFALAANAQEDDAGRRGAAELALSNDTLDIRYRGSGDVVGVDGSGLTGAFFLSEQRDIVLSGGLLFPLDLGIERLSIQLGPQLYAALLEEENNDVMAVSVGAEARYLLFEDLGLAIAGRAYYAPDILTFGSADKLTDLSARVELGVASRIVVFGGMRWFEFDLTEGGGERTLQEEIFVGFGYRL